MSSKPVYEVVSPVGQEPRASGRQKFSAPPLADLRGKKIGLVWTVFPNGHLVLDAFADLLKRRYGDMDFVRLPPGRNALWGQNPDGSLTEVVREAKVDAVIVAAGC
jgi:hypothetical protein